MRSLTLLFLFLTSSVAVGELFKPQIIYIEGQIEKEVSWPTRISVVEQLASREGPRVKVYIAIPDLLRLQQSNGTYQIHHTSATQPSPFADSLQVSKFITFETNQSTVLLKIEKLKKGSAPTPIALKVSFSQALPLFALHSSCRGFYDVETFRPTGAIPFITHVSCPNDKRILVKTTPEIKIANSKKQSTYNLIDISVDAVSPNSLVKISPKTSTEPATGELGLVLKSKGDVVYHFEGRSKAKSANRTKREPSQFPSETEIIGINSIGFTMSEYDPEIFGSVDFKREGWKSYFKVGGHLGVPFLLTGHSIENPVDGKGYFLINRSFIAKDSVRRYSLGIGMEALKRPSPSSYFAWGPRLQLSIEKVYSLSQRAHIGIFLSTSALSKRILKLTEFDRIYEIEGRLTLIQPTGKYFEPKIILQSYNFGNHRETSTEVFKIGLGVRF